MRINDIIHNKSGAAMIIVVVVVVAVSLILVVTVSSLGLGEMEMGFSISQADEAFAIADGCMDETLHRIHLDNNYGIGAGTITLTLTNGSCDIDVTQAGNDRTVIIEGVKGLYHKKIEVTLTLSGGNITINTWKELTN